MRRTRTSLPPSVGLLVALALGGCGDGGGRAADLPAQGTSAVRSASAAATLPVVAGAGARTAVTSTVQTTAPRQPARTGPATSSTRPSPPPTRTTSTARPSAADPITALTPGDLATARRLAAEWMSAPGTAAAVKLVGTTPRAMMPPCINVPVGHACLIVRVDEHVRQGKTPQRPGSTPPVIVVVEVVVDAGNGRPVSYQASPSMTHSLSRLGVPVTTLRVS